MAISTMAAHGVTFRRVPSSIISPIVATSGVNVVIGTAPIQIRDNWQRFVNRPIRCNNWADFVNYLGYVDDFRSYTLCEHAKSYLRLFGCGPGVYLNVLDPAKHFTVVPATLYTLANGQVTGPAGVIGTTVVATSAEDDEAVRVTYERGRDYLISWTTDLRLVITRVPAGTIPTPASQILLAFNRVDLTAIDASDIIGGVDINTGIREGIEAVELVFAETGLVPGYLLAPGYSDDPAVAAVLETKAQDINGCFKTRCGIDVADSIDNVLDILDWKSSNNVVSPRQDLCFPYVDLGDDHFHTSTQLGSLLMWTDATQGAGIPYWSPSNQPLKANRTSLADGTEFILTKDQADNLNRIGVVTALNWAIYGWKLWGNRTAAGGGIATEVDEVFIPNARMGDWIGNTFVLTLHGQVDRPGNRRRIDTIVNSFNRWLASLYAQDALLGGRIEFRHEDNPIEQLMDAHYIFRVLYLSPTPMEWIEALLEVDTDYFLNLWEAA